MAYRVCLNVQPGFIQLEDPFKWNAGQVHDKYPTLSGSMAIMVNLALTSMLGDSAPNMSLIFESGTGSAGKMVCLQDVMHQFITIRVT